MMVAGAPAPLSADRKLATVVRARVSAGESLTFHGFWDS